MHEFDLRWRVIPLTSRGINLSTPVRAAFGDTTFLGNASIVLTAIILTASIAGLSPIHPDHC
jgi:hypothetical protein